MAIHQSFSHLLISSMNICWAVTRLFSYVGTKISEQSWKLLWAWQCQVILAMFQRVKTGWNDGYGKFSSEIEHSRGKKKNKTFLEEWLVEEKKKCKKELFMVRTRGRAFHAEKQLVDDLRKVTSFSYKEQSKDQCGRNIMSSREGQGLDHTGTHRVG